MKRWRDMGLLCCCDGEFGVRNCWYHVYTPRSRPPQCAPRAGTRRRLSHNNPRQAKPHDAQTQVEG